MIKKSPILVFLFLLLVLVHCHDRFRDTEYDNICGQEPCYEGPFDPPWVDAHLAGLELNFDIALTHDNRVLETDNFLVFSDASEDWAKIRTGETAEDAWVMISGHFQIDPEDLGIRDIHSKIRVYSKRQDDTCGSNAYYNGFTVPATDGPVPSFCIELIPTILKHEFTHVTQFRLGGLYDRVWDWFTEGVAEHVSGGVYQAILCWPELDAWRQDPGHVNPITIQYLEQIPDYDTIDWLCREQYYPVFAVAVRYLVDPKGHGKTYVDVKNMFRDIGNGMTFTQAFEIHMGLPVSTYEEHFYEWMEAYLPVTCD